MCQKWGVVVSLSNYVPVLLTRQGERKALVSLEPAQRDRMTPLMVITPIDWDFDNDAPAKTLDRHLSKLPADLATCLGTSSAFIDGKFIDDDPMSSGEHPLFWLIRETSDLGPTLIPVASPNRTGEYLSAVSDVVTRYATGICLRLTSSEWPSALGHSLDILLLDLNVTPAEVDLVLDIEDQVSTLALTALRAELRGLPYSSNWRSLTVLGAAMPKNVPPGKGVHVVSRDEWILYKELLSSPTLPRVPDFGDYVIANPDPILDVDPRILNISASFRYTSQDDWLIVKGELYKGNGGKSLGGVAVPPVANLLISQTRFMPGHCLFENWLHGVASGTNTPGNPTTWRQYATLHHLIETITQIASFHAPSGALGPTVGAP
jgi:hypothetical protein